MVIRMKPSNEHGMDVILHWNGAGWYAPIQRGQVVHEHYIPGFDRDGFSDEDEDRVWDAATGLGTPHWLNSVADYRGYVKA